MSVAHDKAELVADELVKAGVLPSTASSPTSILTIVMLILGLVKMVADCFGGDQSKAAEAIRNPSWWHRFRLRWYVMRRLSGLESDLPGRDVSDALLKAGATLTDDEFAGLVATTRPTAALPTTPEEMRLALTTRLDDLLTHTWALPADDIKILKAVREYFETAKPETMQQILSFMEEKDA